MEELENYQDYLDQAVEWAIGIIPSLITAIVIFFVGLWAITFINKMVRRFFKKKDYDETLESFLQSFISITLKAWLFVVVITQ